MSVAPRQRLEALRRQRQEVLERLSEAAASGTETASLRDFTDRLRYLDVAISEERGATRRLALVVSAGVVALTLTFLVTARVATTEVEAIVEASDIRLDFDGVEALTGVAIVGPVSVTGFSKFEVQGMELAPGESDFDSGLINASMVMLRSFRTSPGDVITLSAAENELEISFETSPREVATVALETQGKGSLDLRQINGPSAVKAHPLTESEVLRVSAVGSNASAIGPLRFNSHAGGKLQMNPATVRRISFRRQAAPEGTLSKFESSVFNAKIRVGPKARETSLEEGDDLQLDGLKSTSLKISSCLERPSTNGKGTCQGVLVRFVGNASRVEVSRSGGVTQLKPTLLEFFKDSYLVALIWGAAVFLWGTGWSVWKALAR